MDPLVPSGTGTDRRVAGNSMAEIEAELSEVYISWFESVCAPPKPNFTYLLADELSVHNHLNWGKSVASSAS